MRENAPSAVAVAHIDPAGGCVQIFTRRAPLASVLFQKFLVDHLGL